MTLYVETSALLRWLLEGEADLLRAFRDAERLVTSKLTSLEAERGLRRGLHERRLDQVAHRAAQRELREFLQSCVLIDVDDEILTRAGAPFPVEPIRTLDAIHLASALGWAEHVEPTAMASCDARVVDNASALGLPTIRVES